MKKRVAILGASPKEDRFAFRAQKMLMDSGFAVAPVNPAFEHILGQSVFARLPDAAAKQAIDTMTVYINATRSSALEEDFILSRPRRVIFNPGAENPALEKKLAAQGIEVVNDCTLVMLRGNYF